MRESGRKNVSSNTKRPGGNLSHTSEIETLIFHFPSIKIISKVGVAKIIVATMKLSAALCICLASALCLRLCAGSSSTDGKLAAVRLDSR